VKCKYCSLYINHRTNLLNQIVNHWNIDVTINTLLYGSLQLSEDENSDLFKLVQQYIKQIGRFD